MLTIMKETKGMKIKKTLKLAALLALSAAMVLHFAPSAYAAMNIIVNQTGWNTVPKGDIDIDMKRLTIRDAEVTLSSNFHQ